MTNLSYSSAFCAKTFGYHLVKSPLSFFLAPALHGKIPNSFRRITTRSVLVSLALFSLSCLPVHAGTIELTQQGSIVAQVTNPTGGGNHNLEVIRDGDKPPVGNQDSSRQWDSYTGNITATPDWVGYQYTSSKTFNQVIFQEGKHFGDGGWFNGALTVQVLQSGTWVNVPNVTATPTYRERTIMSPMSLIP